MKNNKIVLSIVVGSLLFTQSYALPSGGKFTHGTSGSINVNGNTMNITGNKVNSVIQWGGGFNIANGETVNFGQGKTNQNYLNIAYGTKSSTIDGLLNATGNNVYLINPNGVVIGKSGTINANKFGVSTSSMSNTEMQNFANSSNLVFSPKFTANKGNVINMGNINAKDVLIIGNEVGNIGTNGVGNFNLQDNGKIQFVGDKVKVNVGSIKNANSIIVSAQTAATLGQSTTDVYKNGNSLNKIQVKEYNGLSSHLQTNQMTKKTTIANVEDWAYFAKGINEDNMDMQSVDTFDLISDIDFGANCNSEGVCTGQNYANYWLDLNADGKKDSDEYFNMIVGIGGGYDQYGVATQYLFDKTFNGNGHALSNINIDTTINKNLKNIGLFGFVKEGTIKDLVIDYKGGGIKTNQNSSTDVGSFAGNIISHDIKNTLINNISVKNIGNILVNNSSSSAHVGGFAGNIQGTIINIVLDNIANIKVYNSDYYVSAGGFAGWGDGILQNISVNNIGNISGILSSNKTANSFVQVGGFLGSFGADFDDFKNISINHIGNITANNDNGQSYAGGFAGYVNLARGKYNNFSVNNINSIKSNGKADGDFCVDAGGFAGGFYYDTFAFNNISVENIKEIGSINTKGKSYSGGFAGYWWTNLESKLNNIIVSDIENITSYSDTDVSYAGGFIGYSDTDKPIQNIFVFLNPNTTITGTHTSLFSWLQGFDTENLKNIHIYYKKGSLSNATADNKYWNKVDSFTDVGQDGKINIHTYDNSSKDEAYQAFLNKAGDITITPPETPNINPDNSDFIVNRTDNKISQNDIDKDVINSILADTNVDSWINVNDNPMNVHIDNNDINALNQSFDFMEALGSNFINTYLKDSANDITKILQAKTNIQALIGNVNNLVNNYNDFQSTKEDLNKAIDAYNAYVALINQGAASSKDAEFISLKNKVNELYAKAQGYLDANNFNKTLESYKTQASDYTKDLQGKFSIKGEFDTKLASLDSVLDKPNNEGGDTSNPEANAPLPFSEALLTQMDKSVLKQDEDDKEPTVDEASTQLSGNACIVSDNFKAGNPCSR
ncbi:filamentous hemagglutinin N-terminal domain-containing protein [Campylobacter jejuni]|nr:filamentous hemagglutinin N-terminal domain-containing protein [Campylobacter jejuni]EME0205017.1 filamentous hemagglutinin N-terminal domain-containing protein [Campylobacter jejuni]